MLYLTLAAPTLQQERLHAKTSKQVNRWPDSRPKHTTHVPETQST